MQIKGKTCLITGSARRLGKEIALGLADKGVNLILHYRRSEKEVKELAKLIKEKGVDCWTISGDLQNEEQTKRVIEVAFNAKYFDILINNASIFPERDLNSSDFIDLELTLKVNSLSPFILSRLFYDKVKEGQIINVLDSIISGYNFSRFPYYLSKKLLEIITYSLAIKFSPKVRVNAVAPGLILPPEGKGEEYLEERSKLFP